MMYKDKLISRLVAEHNLEDEDMLYLLKNRSVKSDLQLKTAARDETDRIFGKAVYIRGLIEFIKHMQKQLLLLRNTRRQ